MIKRILAAALAGILLIQLAGCGNDAKEAEQTSADKSGDDYVYMSDFTQLNQEGYYVSSAVFGKDNMLYYVMNKEKEAPKISSVKIEKDKELTPEEIPFEAEAGMQISGIYADDENNLIFGMMKAQTNAEEGTSAVEKAEIVKMTAEGKIIETFDITNYLSKIPDAYIGGIVCDKEVNYYLNTGKDILIFKSNGDLINKASADGYINHILTAKDGSVIAGYYGSMGWKMQTVSIAGNMEDVQSKIPFDYGIYRSGKDTDLLYTQSNLLYTCNLTDEKSEKVLDLLSCDIDSNTINTMAVLADNSIAIVSAEWNENPTAELAVLTQKKRSEVPEKTILTYGALYLPYFASKDIADFNKQSEKYRIEIKEYGDDNTDYQEKVNQMNADIAGGNGTDMIDLVYGPDKVENYTSKGILEDLTPYLESDSEIKKEDFIENVAKAFEIDGKLYGIAPSFGLRTIIGRVSDVGEASTWTIEDVIKLAESKPKDAELFEYASKASMLHTMCSINMNKFVNWETGECSFTGEEFARILEFANRFPKEVNYDPNGPSQMEKLRSGQLVLLDTSVTSVQMFQMYEYMFNEPVNYIGYPVEEGSGTVIAPNGTTVGMNAASKNKEGVWEFIRFILSKERQMNVEYAGGGFPSSKTAFEEKLNKDMQAEYYEDANGIQKETPKSTWGGEDYQVEVFAATKEQTDRIKEMAENADSRWESDEQMFSIISEEAQSYFEGQKKVQDVAEMIQNRVQTYVNESR